MELSPEEKASLAVQSLADCCAVLAELSGGMKREEFFDAYVVPETFWYHRVLLRPGCASPEELVSRIAQGAAEGSLPPLLGWLDDDYPDTRLFPALKRAGYIPMTKQTAMYRPLADWAEQAAPPPKRMYGWSIICLWRRKKQPNFRRP